MTKPLTIFASFPTSPFTDCRSNGDGLVAWNFVRSLAERGHSMHVVTPYASLRHSPPASVKVHQMSETEPRRKTPALAYMAWSRRMLGRIRKESHVDLIHELNPVFSALSLAFTGCGLPVVLGPHSSRWPADADSLSSDTDGPQRPMPTWLKDACVSVQHRQARAVLLSTPAALNNVTRPERLLDKLFLLPPGVDDVHFSPSPAESGATPVILYLANVVVRKGIFTLLDAFEIVARRVENVRLLIAGSGPDLAAVRARVAAADYAGRVEFAGNVSRDQVPALMRGSAVYCLPSHGEPFGMSAVEAMACGKPLVVTGSGGPGYIVSAEGGRRVPVRDAESLATAITEILLDDELRAKMGAHNRAQVESLYSWGRVASRLERIYEYALTGAADRDRMTIADVAEYRRRSASGTGARLSRDRRGPGAATLELRG